MLIRSYKSAFILLFVVLLVATVSSVAFNAYRRASQVTLELSASTIAEISDKTVQRTVDIFEAAWSWLEVNALVVGDGDVIARNGELLRLFWRQLELTPQILSIYVADAGGSFVQAREVPQLVTRVIDRRAAPPSERLVYRDRGFQPIAHINGGALYEPTEEEWYRGAGPDGAVHWSDVHRFAGLDRSGFTASRAIPGGGAEKRAVIGVDIALDGLSEFLAEQRIAKGGVAVIVDREDRLVAFPYQLRLKPRPDGKAYEGVPRVTDLADRWLVDAYRGLQDGSARPIAHEAGTFAVSESNGRRYIAQVADFPPAFGGAWRLFIVVPEAALLSAADRLLSESFVISIIILVIAVLIVYRVGVRFFEPVRRLARNTELIRDFRFDAVEPVRSRYREIEVMDKAICSMRQGLAALEKLVPADLVRHLIRTGQELRPGGEVRELTLFLSGIAGFSDLCRRLPPERITDLLTGRLERYTQVILRQKGTIDKYLSDSVVAFWGAPAAVDDGAARACRSALACRCIDDELRRAWAGDLMPPASLYAVHTGPAIVGNIGSHTRMSYTAIGENVELAAHLRQLNHRYGTRILVSGATRQDVEDDFWWRRVDVLPLDDLGLELVIHELIEERTVPLCADTQDFVRDYEAGLAAVLAADWEEGQRRFETLAASRPGDRSVRLMLRRCQARDAGLCSEGDGGAGGVLSDWL